MSDTLHESYISQYIGAQKVPLATVVQQGGEPTLIGLGFFRKAMATVLKYRQPYMTIQNTIQPTVPSSTTNGVDFSRITTSG
jgi:uncharacterized protein